MTDCSNRDKPMVNGDVESARFHNTHGTSHDDITLIATIAAVFGIGVILWIAPFIGGDLKWDGDVVNRAVVLGYDKSSEVRLFILSCLLIPGMCGFLVFLRRMQERFSYCRGSYIEVLIHFPLVLWPLFVLFSPEHLGIGLLVTWMVYCSARVALFVRCWAPDLLTEHEKLDVVEESDFYPVRNNRREFIFASILLGAIGVSSIVGPLITVTLPSKTIMLLSLVSGILIMALIWLIVSLLISRIVAFTTASIIGGIFLLPTFILVFINLHPYNPGIQTGLFIVCSLFCIGVGGFFILRNIVNRSSFHIAIDWIPKISTIIWWVIAPAVLYASVYIQNITGPIDLYHEGERITPAEAIEEGAAPYKDIFLWHGLFENGVKARLGFRFDDSVSGVRRIEHLLEPLELVALYVLLSVCLRSPFLGLVVAVFAGYTLPSPHGRYWLAYLSYASMTAWIVWGRRNLYLVGLGGALATLAIFYSLDGGLAAAVALVAALVYGFLVPHHESKDLPGNGVRMFGAVLLGVCSGAIIPLGYLAYNGSIGAWIQTAWDIAGGLSDRSSIPYPSLLVGVEKALRNGFLAPLESKIFALYLPPFVIIWGLSHIFTRRITGVVRGSLLTLPVVTIGAALFFRAVIRRPDADHLGKILPLLVTVISVLILHHVRRLRTREYLWTYYVSHWLMLVLGVYTLFWIFTLDSETAPAVILKSRSSYHAAIIPREPVRPIDLDRTGTGVVAHPARAVWLERLVNLLLNRLDAGDTFYDFTNRGLLYFLADRPCPTRYAQTTYAGSRRAQREVIHDLSMRKPSLVVFPSTNPIRYAYDHLNHPFRHPLITRFLYRNYLPWTMVGDAIILRLKEDAGSIDRHQAQNYIRSHRFNVDIGHIPRLLGELPVDSKSIRLWSGKDLARSWRLSPKTASDSRNRDGMHIDTKRSQKVISPRLSVVPDAAHTIVVKMRSRIDGDVRLEFSSARHNSLDGSAVIAFRVKGGEGFHEYRIDVGLLAAWVWRGRVTRMQFDFGPETELVEIASIEIESYLDGM